MPQAIEIASISSIAYHLGNLKPIDEIDFLRDDPQKLELYRLAGFEFYAESDLSMRELAYRSASQTLETCGIDHCEIGICLYVAESHDRDELVNSLEVNRLLVDLALSKSIPIHVSISNCANIVSALRVAAALIQAGVSRQILVASVDKASRRPGGRKMFQEMSIKSDVSLSCLVSGPGKGPYAIEYLGQHNAAALAGLEKSDCTSYAMPKFQGIRHAANQAKDTMGLKPSDFAKIVINNYGKEITKMFIGLCGFSENAGWYTNIKRFAHAVAGDVLINLKDIETSGEIRAGDRIFMMSDSVSLSSVLCLRKRTADL